MGTLSRVSNPIKLAEGGEGSSSRGQLRVQGRAGGSAEPSQPLASQRPRQVPEQELLSGKETRGFDAAALISLTATD